MSLFNYLSRKGGRFFPKRFDELIFSTATAVVVAVAEWKLHACTDALHFTMGGGNFVQLPRVFAALSSRQLRRGVLSVVWVWRMGLVPEHVLFWCFLLSGRRLRGFK